MDHVGLFHIADDAAVYERLAQRAEEGAAGRDDELALFMRQAADDAHTRARQAERLLAQRLAE